MRYLHLNVASSRRLNLWRYWGVMVLLLGLAVVLIWSGLGQFDYENGLTAKEKKEMLSLREADRNFPERMQRFQEEIKELKRRWNPQVRFANTLISRKAFSFIKGLDLLEKALPESVYLQRLAIEQDRPTLLQMEVLAPAFADLIQAYRRLSAYQLEVNSEVRDKNGRYRVSLSMRTKP